MTVEELISLLKEYPGDLEVVLYKGVLPSNVEEVGYSKYLESVTIR